MADPIVKPSAMDPASIEENNRSIAQKVAGQDIMGKSLTPSETEPAQSALDKLFQEKETALKAAAGGKEAPDSDAPPTKPNGELVEPVEPAAPPEKPAVEPAAPAEPTPEQKRAEEMFKEAPPIPKGASPKTNDAFNFVKVEAARKLMELEAQLTKANEALKAQTERRPTTEELEQEKEFKELKAWRAKVDLEFDPSFKQYDRQISEASEFVYSQLKKSPQITDEHIKLIKQYGGPHKIVMSKLFSAINDPTLQRLVEGQISEIAKIEYQKERKQEEAKQNIEQFTNERAEFWKNQATAHTMETQKQLDGLLKSLDWFAPKKAADNAEAPVKKAAEEHNAFLTELQDQIKAASTDDSPQMRAVLVAGMAQLFNLKREHAALKAESAAAVKERDELKAKFEKVKQSATTRLREGSAPAEGVRPAAPKPVGAHTRTGDAVDELAKQVMAERQAKGLPV